MKILEHSPSFEKSPKTRHKTKPGHREFLCPCALIVSREHVEAGNIDVVLTALSALGILDPVNADVNTLTWLRSQIAILFVGYDHDARELFQIPEVRAFWQALHIAWPYGLYFFQREAGTLMNLFMSHLETRVEREADSPKISITAPDQGATKKFLVSSVGPLLEMTKRMGWSSNDLGQFLKQIQSRVSPIPDPATQLKLKLALMMQRPETDPFHPVPLMGQVTEIEFRADGVTILPTTPTGKQSGGGETLPLKESEGSRTARHLAFLKSHYAIFAAIAWLHYLHGGRGALIFARKHINSPTFRYVVETRNYANLLQDPFFSEYEQLVHCVAKYNPKTHFVACIRESDAVCCVELGIPELPPPVAYQDRLLASESDSEDE